MKLNSIRFKLLSILTILLSAGFIIVSFMNDLNNTNDFISITEQKISAECLRYITYINSYEDIMFANGNSTARTGEILFLEHQNINKLKSSLNKYLISQVRSNPTIYGSGIWYEPPLFHNNDYIGPYAYWKNNNVQLTYEFSEHDFTKDNWYQIGLPEHWDRNRKRDQKQYVTPPYDYGDGHIYITIDTLMYGENDTIIGLTSTDWTLDFLPLLLKDFKITENSTIYFLDPKTGKHLYNKNPSLIFTDYRDSPAISDLLFKNKDEGIKIVSDLEIDENEVTLYYGRTKLGYILGFVVPDNEAYKNLIILRKRNTLNIFIILIFSLFTFYFLLQRMIFNRLLTLKKAAKRFGRNNFQTRAPVFNSHNEIGELSLNFNYMADQLENTFQDLIESRGKLELLNQELESKVEKRTDYLQNVITFYNRKKYGFGFECYI